MTKRLSAETRALWALSNEIASCRRGGSGSLPDAMEEVECILMHTEHEAIRKRCRAILGVDCAAASRLR